MRFSHDSRNGLVAVLSVLAVVLAVGAFGKYDESSSFAADGASEAPLGRGMAKEKPASDRSVETADGFMVPYTETIPGTDVTFEMIPVPGGTFLMGSPADEVDREEDEGPQMMVEVPPFWIAKCEVTWAEYNAYTEIYEPLKAIADVRAFLTYEATNEAGRKQQEQLAARVAPFPALTNHASRIPSDTDAVTCPTPLYDPSFATDLGDDPAQPATTMTQFAAKQYTKWLSGSTGTSFRLPTEAEWEYAARAGSKTAYCFGDDPAGLDDYAWYFDNSDDQMQLVGTKKPNAWGIHDMHGNVAEWTLDQYVAERYASTGGKTVKIAEFVAWPTQEYPRVIRGGSWSDDPEWCRSAKRLRSGIDWSDPEGRGWKEEDPQIPKSPWWFTEPWTRQIGFRVVRPLVPMTDEQKARSWDADVDDVRDAVDVKLEEGRGVVGIADRKLPDAIRDVEKYGNEEE